MKATAKAPSAFTDDGDIAVAIVDAGTGTGPARTEAAEAATIIYEGDPIESIVTKDPIHLADVPVAADEHVRPLTITTIDKDGKRRTEKRDGKVLYRMGPHPTFVQVGDRVLKRDEVLKAADLALAKPIMVNQITTVIYERGVVQHDHIDIMHCLLHKMHHRYISTGEASSEVKTTKAEIAKILGVTNNGHLTRNVDDALETLAGLRVIKLYREPDPGQPGHGVIPSVTQMMGGIIVNAETMHFSGGSSSRGGRRADVIRVDMNPAFPRSMCGDTKDRPYLLRSLNFTQNLTHSTRWHRQLHRMIESRIDSSSRFQMPLVEIWIGCLGGSLSDLDPGKPERWRKVRWRILSTLRKWEATGYLQKVEPFMRQPSDRNVTNGEILISTGDSEIAVPADNPALLRSGVVEWVYCEAGPEYFSGRPQNKPQFARQILAGSVEQNDVERMLKDLGPDFILDIGHSRLKRFIRLLGDRSNRMPAAAWLAQSYPIVTHAHQVRLIIDDCVRRDQAVSLGHMNTSMDAPHAQRRATIAYLRIRDKILAGVDVAAMVQLPIRPTDKVQGVVYDCYQLALERTMAENNMSKGALEEDRRVAAGKEGDYKRVVQRTSDIALRAAALLLWYEQIQSKVAKALPRFGEPWSPDLKSALVRRFPEAWGIILEMTGTQRHAWERHLGAIYRQRLGERWVEGEELDRIDPSGKQEAIDFRTL